MKPIPADPLPPELEEGEQDTTDEDDPQGGPHVIPPGFTAETDPLLVGDDG
jgi:hypothetical protein